MKKHEFFILVLTFTLLLAGENIYIFGQMVKSDPSDGVYYTPWKNNVPYVRYIMGDSVKMDASHFVILPGDTLESFYQGGIANPGTPDYIMFNWFLELPRNIPLGDSVVIMAKLADQFAPEDYYSYIAIGFCNKLTGGAYFAGFGSNLDRYKLIRDIVRYTWTVSKESQQVVGDVGTIILTFYLGHIGSGSYDPKIFIQNQIDMSDYKVYKDGKVIFHEPFNFLLTDVPRGNEIPVEFKLEQNYPNPFNPSTKIQFAIPKEGSYELKVYNLLGQEVSTLVSGRLSPGSHTVDFNGNQLPSGVYIYRLTGNGVNLSKKMLLIK